MIDRNAGTVGTLALTGLEKLARHMLHDFKGRVFRLNGRQIKLGRSVIKVSFDLPKDYEYTQDAPIHVDVKSDGQTIARMSAASNVLDKGRHSFPIEIPIESTKTGKNDLVLDGVFYYCRKKSGICLFDELRYELPLNVSPGGSSRVDITVQIPEKTAK